MAKIANFLILVGLLFSALWPMESSALPRRCRDLLAFSEFWSASQLTAVNSTRSQKVFRKIFSKTGSIRFSEYEIPVGDWNAFLNAFRGTNSFSKDQRDALFFYHFNSGRYNPKLWDDKAQLTFSERDEINILDSTFKEGLLNEGTILLRGANGLNVKKGAIVDNAAFMSTTLRPKVAYKFATSFSNKISAIVMLRIPKGGYPAIVPLSLWGESMSSKLEFELEIILPRHSRFKILSKEITDEGILLYRAELQPYSQVPAI